MDTRKIRKLIELVKETGVGELEVRSGEESVRISCYHLQTPVTLASAATPTYTAEPAAISPHAVEMKKEGDTKEKPRYHEGHTIHSPMVGTVYLAPTPGAKPFITVGQHVNAGDTICLIEAMKMFNKIEADQSGVISARLIENEQPVEYDQALFIIETQT
jgi:acetyl-CoA carboxylase biotin carboxyl carrier protein